MFSGNKLQVVDLQVELLLVERQGVELLVEQQMVDLLVVELQVEQQMGKLVMELLSFLVISSS